MISTAKGLVDLVINSGARSLSLVGTAKNAGKTVTMNHLISKLDAKGLTPGLVSSGRDGEAVDAFTGEPKPRVIVPQGAWVVTAQGVLKGQSPQLEIADVFGWPGLYGHLVVGRVRDPGVVELVGPRTARDLGFLVDRLLDFGADLVLVDGALDRRAAASPQVTEAAILAAGPPKRGSVQGMAQELGFLVWLLSRPQHENEAVAHLARTALEEKRVSFIKKGTLKGFRDKDPHACACADGFCLLPTPYLTVLGLEDEISELVEDAVALVVPGVVNDRLLASLGPKVKEPEFSLIAKDAVSFFVQPYPEIRLRVAEKVDLLAVTINPTTGYQMSFDPREIIQEAERTLLDLGHPLPIFDVVSGEKTWGRACEMAVG